MRIGLAGAAAVLAVLLQVSPTAATGATPAKRRDELVVRYARGTNHAERQSLRRGAAVSSAGTISGESQVVRVADGKSPAGIAADLESDPHVEYALPNYVA